MKLSFGSPNSESGRQSYAFWKIVKWVMLKQEAQGHQATCRDVGRPHTKPKPYQTWSKASLHIIGPKGRLVCTNGGPGGVARRLMPSPDVVDLLEGPVLLWWLLTDLPKSVVGTWSILALDQGRFHPMVAKEHDADR